MYCILDADNSFREAQKIKSKYNRKLRHLQVKSRQGDKDAAVEIIRTMTAKARALRDLGYRTTVETEEGRPDRLVRITEEWRQEQLTRETAVDRMARAVRNGEACVGDLIRLMAREEE